MDTPTLKIRGSWLIVEGRRIWIQKPIEIPEDAE